jgi:hypothetical protein
VLAGPQFTRIDDHITYLMIRVETEPPALRLGDVP